MAFRQAKAAKIGGKFLSYGESGSGKSTFQLTFPKVACIDSETGIAHYEGKDIDNGKTWDGSPAALTPYLRRGNRRHRMGRNPGNLCPDGALHLPAGHYLAPLARLKGAAPPRSPGAYPVREVHRHD